MKLTAAILRCPDSVPPQARTVAGGELSIGRGAENDWVLPDPERVLSKNHCILAFRNGGWQVADLSRNGTFLNGGAEPIGAGRAQDLRDGDRLVLGSYEIELRIEADRPVHPASRGAARDAPFGDDPFGDDPFRERPTPAMAGRAVDVSLMPDEPALLPTDFDPLAPDAPAGLTQPDHSASVQDAFAAPRPISRLPDDWDDDLLAPATPVRAPPLATPATSAALPPRAAPVADRVLVPPVATPAPGDGALLAAFLAGAGLEDAVPANPEATMRSLGAAFRALVGGLRETLIARATIKDEFHIEQTQIRSRNNNPLKFSVNDEDALAALLGAGRRTDMDAPAAVAEALRDIRLHELATVVAMQSAVRALVQRLAPAPLREEAERGGGVLPAQKRARAFELYEKLHGEVSRGLTDDFDSVFGKAFARAYERALHEIGERNAG